jgi:hypothetical protein
MLGNVMELFWEGGTKRNKIGLRYFLIRFQN